MCVSNLLAMVKRKRIVQVCLFVDRTLIFLAKNPIIAQGPYPTSLDLPALRPKQMAYWGQDAYIASTAAQQCFLSCDAAVKGDAPGACLASSLICLVEAAQPLCIDCHSMMGGALVLRLVNAQRPEHEFAWQGR